ncbi:hypothetical protein [Streptomyces ficellus]|uniref:Uncharacterized protein n=1 Tax=Streptomyces ficellus TaxID=1977088 RepID=A0A6I6F5G1_9ACTN|nr:hypothetical protein [Streptomyces ficellus]QGV78151.1 hypothetical protein EIZ62_07735 [Streptomyces ficellus]
MVRRRVPLLALALVLGGLWWWAVLRLVLAPGQTGLVEGTVAAGGWGLSLLPVHVASARTASGARAGSGVAGVLRERLPGVLPGAAGAWSEVAGAWSRGRAPAGTRTAPAWRRPLRVVRLTRAWLRRRSGGGSDPS